MKALVLGGTGWLGRQLAVDAAARGHDVTCLARGESGDPPDGIRFVKADRTEPGAYDDVAGDWDAVFDVTRHPGHVRSAIAALGEGIGRYLFVSTGNVYADHNTPGADESAELLPPLDGDLMESMETYGEAKVACELALLDQLGPDRVVIARSGLIGGPGDVSCRSGYWPLRFARPSTDDGSVLVPDDADADSQVIDVRDLSAWLIDSAERRASGVFNAVGETVPLGTHLQAASAAGGAGHSVAVDGAWLLEQEVSPYMGERSLPIWIPIDGYAGWNSRSNARAREAGLAFRPLSETLADVLAWEFEMGADRPRTAGLSDDDERELLAAWSSRRQTEVDTPSTPPDN